VRNVTREAVIVWTLSLRVRNQTIDDERPMDIGHPAIGRETRQLQNLLIDFGSGGFTLRGTV
jgi:hypothetical protein